MFSIQNLKTTEKHSEENKQLFTITCNMFFVVHYSFQGFKGVCFKTPVLNQCKLH